jgi:hypothetical protein
MKREILRVSQAEKFITSEKLQKISLSKWNHLIKMDQEFADQMKNVYVKGSTHKPKDYVYVASLLEKELYRSEY